MQKNGKLISVGIVILIFALSLHLSTKVRSLPQGVSGNSETGCTPCHGSDPNDETSVVINGLPFAYEPDMNYSLTVVVSSTNVSGNDGGFDLSVTAGTIVVTDSTNTQIKSGDLTHTDAGRHQRSWTFNWTAPTEGNVVFYVAGLASDDSGDQTGDAWATYSTAIDIIPEFTAITLLIGLASAAIVVLLLNKRAPRPTAA